MALALFVFSALTITTQAQMQAPAPSPAATVSQVVGFTKISIDYSSPAVKGRKVFGDLEKFGTPWRAGANAATTITFSTAVKVGETTLRPGTYSIFITPMESGAWKIHLNKEAKAIFAYMADGAIDGDALAKDLAVTVDATPVMLSDTMERLAYHISAENNKEAKVSMAWNKTMVSFTVDVMVNQMMENMQGVFK
jgi:hypothetical protein